jgi:hypothetical protein
MAAGDGKASKWVWIASAAITTFLIASVLPTPILRSTVLLCLDVGFPSDVCIAPFQGTADLSGSQITGLSLSMTTTTKVVLALIAAALQHS